MATTYATKIVVSATDNASGAISKIGKAVTGSLNTMASSVRTLGSGIAKTTQFLGNLNQARLLIASAVGSAAGFIQGIADTGDELGAFSDKTGLSVESIQAWRYAAEQSDVSTEQFNASIERFAVGLAAARQGTGPLAAGLKKLSQPLLDQLNKTTDTEEALGLYIAAMEELPDASDKALAAGLAFGKGNKDMALLAVQGSEALKKLREQKLKDGVMSTKQAEEAGKLDEQLKSLKSKYDGIKVAIGGKLIPVLTPLLEKLSAWIERNRELIGQKIAGAIGAIAEAIAAVDWGAVWAGVEKVWGAFKTVAGWIADATKAVGGFTNAVLLLGSASVLRSVWALGAALATAAGARTAAAAAAGIGTAATAAGGVGTAATAAGGIGAAAGGAMAVGGVAVAGLIAYGVTHDTRYQDEVDAIRANKAHQAEQDRVMLESYTPPSAAPPAPGYSLTRPGPTTMDLVNRLAPKPMELHVKIDAPPGMTATAAAPMSARDAMKLSVDTGARQVGTGAP